MFKKLLGSEAKIMTWLKKSTSDARPAFEDFHADSDHLVTTDGITMHAVNSLCDFEANKNFRLDYLRNSAGIVEVISSDHAFPEYKKMVADIENKAPAIRMAINKQLLIDALSAMDEVVIINFHSPTAPLEIMGKLKGSPAIQLYAAVMPLQERVTKEERWKP